jgi:glycerophosphocholine phosphodiesterase GPCPD1
MNLRINAESSSIDDCSMSNDTRENQNDQPAYAFSEVATFNSDDDFHFQPQEQFGRAYRKDDIMVFNVTVTEPENIAYLVDLYTYSSRADEGEPPYHLGYHYLLPNMLKHSEGQLELPITCASKHRPLGMMKIEFLKITPLIDVGCDMKASEWSASGTA